MFSDSLYISRKIQWYSHNGACLLSSMKPRILRKSTKRYAISKFSNSKLIYETLIYRNILDSAWEKCRRDIVVGLAWVVNPRAKHHH